MGFPDDFKIVVSPMQMFRQAGNSIVVDVMMAIVKNILSTGVFEEDSLWEWLESMRSIWILKNVQ